MQWKKDPNLKYTDMCIWIDANIPNIVNPGEHPDIEDKLYNYLWLLVKALAIKKCMFTNFQDYDPFAFYAANRLFMALRKNYWNQGKTIKGKQIRPIKSCLNYTKALLYPMKVEYQNEQFKEVISEEFVSKKFDALAYQERLRDQARDAQDINVHFKSYIESTFDSIGSVLDRVMQRTPYRVNSPEYKWLRITLMLNTLNSLNLKNRLNSELPTVILWKMPKSSSAYVRVLIKEFYSEIKSEIMECHRLSTIDDDTIDKLLQPPLEEYDYREEQY
jgi:hypothetical protein